MFKVFNFPLQYNLLQIILTTHSAWAIEYANCISTEGLDPANEYSGYDTKLSDSETPVLELWGMSSASLLPLPPGPLRPGVVVPVTVLSIG